MLELASHFVHPGLPLILPFSSSLSCPCSSICVLLSLTVVFSFSPLLYRIIKGDITTMHHITHSSSFTSTQQQSSNKPEIRSLFPFPPSLHHSLPPSLPCSPPRCVTSHPTISYVTSIPRSSAYTLYLRPFHSRILSTSGHLSSLLSPASPPTIPIQLIR